MCAYVYIYVFPSMLYYLYDIVESIVLPESDTKYTVKCGFNKMGSKSASGAAAVSNAPSVTVLPKHTSVLYPEKLSVTFTLYLGENGLYLVIKDMKVI